MQKNKKENIIKIAIIVSLIVIGIMAIILLIVKKNNKIDNEYLNVNYIIKNININESFNILTRVENNQNPVLKYTSNNENCKVENNKITGLKQGVCIITVNYKNLEKKVTVYIKDPSSKDKITEFRLVTKKEITLNPKELHQISISIKPDYLGGSIKYNSNNTEICTVDYTGNVKAIKPGNCEITATIDGSNTKLITKIKINGDSSLYEDEPGTVTKPEKNPEKEPDNIPENIKKPLSGNVKLAGLVYDIELQGGTCEVTSEEMNKCLYYDIEESRKNPCKCVSIELFTKNSAQYQVGPIEDGKTNLDVYNDRLKDVVPLKLDYDKPGSTFKTIYGTEQKETWCMSAIRMNQDKKVEYAILIYATVQNNQVL